MLLAQIPEDVQYRGDGKRERLLLARGVPDPCCPLSRCLGLAVCPRGQHPLPGAAAPGIQEFLGSVVRMEEHAVPAHSQDRVRVLGREPRDTLDGLIGPAALDRQRVELGDALDGFDVASRIIPRGVGQGDLTHQFVTEQHGIDPG